MREIKFRAWDNEMSEMLPAVDVLIFLANGTYKVLFGKKGEDGLNTIWEAIPMQFTGLKDKNGKEIYEGDIIKIKHPYKEREFTGAVEWIKHRWGCNNFYFTHFDSPGDIFSEGTEYITVIGNIYENPDLCKSNI